MYVLEAWQEWSGQESHKGIAFELSLDRDQEEVATAKRGWESSANKIVFILW